jgi:glycosyltransferase involved in cell wall biosynthesis
MKILYCIDHLRADGTQRFLTQLVEGLNVRGHQQSVLCLNGSVDSEVIARLASASAEVATIGKLPLLGGYGVIRAWHWVKDRRFDVGVTLLFASDVVGRTLMHAAGMPRVLSSLRARNIHYTPWQRWLVRRTMPWADAVILNSASVREFAIEQEGASPERIHVIPNGVRLEDYAVPIDRDMVRSELGLPVNQPVIGSAGRLTDQKGYDVLLQAMALLPRPEIHLLLIGSGEEELNLHKLAETLGLEARIHFFGYRHDVPRLLHALDVYVQPSRFEGMPNALLEAMAAGCPVVATAVDGNRELIDDGVHGWLTPVDNAAALAEAIKNAVVDRNEAQQRAACAQQRVQNEFSVEAMVDAWQRVLTKRD